jgi:hypothetical protein
VDQQGPGAVFRRQQAVQRYPYPLPPLDGQAGGLVEDKDLIVFKKYVDTFQCGSRGWDGVVRDIPILPTIIA